jgi:hypothetical protein
VADPRAQVPERPFGHAVGDLTGLGVAVQHGVAHLVDRAGAHRVVGRVADDPQPGLVEQRRRPPLGRQEQRGEGLGHPFEGPLGPGRGLADVDPVRGHAHQQVGSGAGAQLARPGGQVVVVGVAGDGGQVLGQRGDDQLEVVLQGVGLGHHPAQPGLGGLVVGAVHPQDGRAAE